MNHRGGVLYVARAGVDHRRVGADARLPSLARTAYARGRAARRLDVRRGGAPTLKRELATLGGCLGHVIRRRCLGGLTMVAHSTGRLQQGLLEKANGKELPDPGSDDFLSGSSGTVGGVDVLRRSVGDEAVNAWELASGRRMRLALAARHRPSLRRVLVLGIERPEHRGLFERMRAEMLSSRHDVEFHASEPGRRGKFENLNRLLAAHPAEGHDWLLVVDDDVELARGLPRPLPVPV